MNKSAALQSVEGSKPGGTHTITEDLSKVELLLLLIGLFRWF